MGNFIKELTIIDFLGILVPGGLVLLLFNPDFSIRKIWCSYFNPGSVADSVIFLVAGYLIGMLLHETGDLFEKLIRKCPLFDPCYYAAKKVTLPSESSYVLVTSTYFLNAEINLQSTTSSKMGNAVIDSTSQDKSSCLKTIRQFIFSSIGVYIILSSVFFFPLLLKSESNIKNVLFALFSLLMILLITVVGIRISKPLNKLQNSEAMKFASQNSVIQTKIFGKASAAKRQIFDGFYYIMRNLLLVMGVTNTYALFFTNSQYLAQKVSNFYKNDNRTLLYCIIGIVMLIRCCHYAYLKYKYSYEDYLYLLDKVE